MHFIRVARPWLFAFLGFATILSVYLEAKTDDELIEIVVPFTQGYQTFRDLNVKEHEAEFLRLAREGQTPKALYIGCSDSRVMPELFANARPGDLFVIRNAGNFVPTYDTAIAWDGIAATIEYAVEVLGIKEIIVCGHSHCGAIQALFSKKDAKGPELASVAKWLQFGREAQELTVKNVPPDVTDEQLYSITEHVSVLFQLNHLLTYPYIKDKVQKKALFLHGWFFDIATARLWYFDPAQSRFIPIEALAN